MKTIDKLKKRLLENPKIKMMAHKFPQDTKNTVLLKDILEDNPDQKYFLSKEATEKLLKHLKKSTN